MEVSIISRRRPGSAVHGNRSNKDKLTEEILETGRKLSKTHINLVKERRGGKIQTNLQVGRLEVGKKETEIRPPIVIDALIVHREQGTSPLTTFQDSYHLPDPRPCTYHPYVHNIHLEAFQPLPPRPKPPISTYFAEKVAPFYTHKINEIGLNLIHSRRKMSDPGSVFPLRTDKKPEEQKANCEKKHPNRAKKFMKRPLSASFSFRNNSRRVFDPYDVYNVANGMFDVGK